MYSFHQEKSNTTIPPEEIAKLLRSIGASGRLVGFNYVVYIVYKHGGRHETHILRSGPPRRRLSFAFENIVIPSIRTTQ